MNGRTRRFYEEFSHEGVEVISSTHARHGTHVKVRCRYQGHEFVYVASINTDDQGLRNRAADLRRIKRAIRKQDMTVLAKFKVQRSNP